MRAQDAPSGLPITGVAGPGLERLDAVVGETMRQLEIPGAGLAVARNGALVLAKGYGWADRDARVPAGPETLFAAGQRVQESDGCDDPQDRRSGTAGPRCAGVRALGRYRALAPRPR